MEQQFGGPGPEVEPGAEKEPQVEDVFAATRHVIGELAPDADPEDVEVVLGDLEAAVDVEEAMGIAGGAFAMLGIDYDEGLGKLGEILQVEAILPNGDQGEAAN
ncbi:MAG TPA: hypothetical protein VJM46_03930 [Candidatus Saccharimonadales bacterium]|nr:hypothetical protein [Candidatus Saccharimonadales bacterium]